MSNDKYSHGKIAKVTHQLGDHTDPHSIVKRALSDLDSAQYYLSMAFYTKADDQMARPLTEALIHLTKVTMQAEAVIRTISGSSAVETASKSALQTSDAALMPLESVKSADSESPVAMTESVTPAQARNPFINGEIENVNVVPNEEE